MSYAVFLLKVLHNKRALDKRGKCRRELLYISSLHLRSRLSFGIFWGENGQDDKIWHSIAQGNCNTNINALRLMLICCNTRAALKELNK